MKRTSKYYAFFLASLFVAQAPLNAVMLHSQDASERAGYDLKALRSGLEQGSLKGSQILERLDKDNSQLLLPELADQLVVDLVARMLRYEARVEEA
eukprot:scaffold231017_cov34-Prasinocladus_malaysianus.AAC.1